MGGQGEGQRKGWKERGRGELRVLSAQVEGSEARTARLVMRKAGNQELLLNASIYRGMSLKKNGANTAVFQAANCVQEVAKQGDSKTPKLEPFLVRARDPAFVEGLVRVGGEAAE